MNPVTKQHVSEWIDTRIARGLVDKPDAMIARDWINNELIRRNITIDPTTLKRSPFRSGDSLYAAPVVYLWCGWLLNNAFSNRNPEANATTILKATEVFCGSRLVKKNQYNKQNHGDAVSIALSYMFNGNPNTVICRPVSIAPIQSKLWERKTNSETGFGERVRERIRLKMWQLIFSVIDANGDFRIENITFTCPESKIDEMSRAVDSGDSILLVRQAHGELTYKSQSVNNVFFLSVFRAVAHRIGETIGRQPGKNNDGKPASILTLEAIPGEQWATMTEDKWDRIIPADVFRYMEQEEITTAIDNRILMDHYQILQCEGGSRFDWFEAVQSYTGIKSFQNAEKRLYRIRKKFKKAHEALRYKLTQQ